MASLYLIRHAHSQVTEDAPEHWPLSSQGQREARAVADQDFWREIAAIYTSPEPKARQTVEAAARRWAIPLETVDCLHELRRPQPIPDYETVIARLFAQPEASIAGLEPAAQASRRISRCIREIATAHPGQKVAIASHGLVLSLFLAQLENRWPTVAEWRAVPFAGLAIVESNPWHLVENWSKLS